MADKIFEVSPEEFVATYNQAQADGKACQIWIEWINGHGTYRNMRVKNESGEDYICRYLNEDQLKDIEPLQKLLERLGIERMT